MSLSLDEHSTKLINNILFATSQQAVKGLIDIVMATLEQNHVNGHTLERFVEKISSELESFSPLKQEAQQWSNIKMAKIVFNRINHSLKAPIN
jgi:hypothetical protein